GRPSRATHLPRRGGAATPGCRSPPGRPGNAGHEAGGRAGTENVPYVVGLGRACEIARASLATATTRLQALRERLWERLRAGLGECIVLNGHPERRLPNTLNASFVGHI